MIQLRYLNCRTLTRLSVQHNSLKMPTDTMLKSRLIASELMKKRVEEKQNKKNIILNRADFQILGSYTPGFRPSLLVNSEGVGYLFNCCEGTQRFCYSNKVKLRNIEHLFVTKLSWNHVAGAFGLALTMQDVGSPSFTIHGPENIDKIYSATKSFMFFNTGIVLSTRSPLDGDYQDSNIHVKTIVIDKNAMSGVETDHGDQSIASKKIRTTPKLLAYACKLPDTPGPLDPKKCRELKVPIGPLLGNLKMGHDITLPDGTIVKSSDVCGEKNLGLKFLIVECPSEKDIDLIINNDTLHNYRQARQSESEIEVGMIVHFSPDEVTNHPKYQDWMNGFSDDCKHLLLLSNEPNRANFIESYRLQYLLNHLDDKLFPVLHLPDSISKIIDGELIESSSSTKSLDYGLSDPDETDPRTVLKGEWKDLDRIIKVSNLDRFIVRPSKVLESIETPMHIDALYRAAKVEPHFSEIFEEYKNLQDKIPPPREHEPEVIFLGTGSALPSKLRNTSGIIVNFQKPQDASIILDCGEDTYGQLLRFYGPEETELFLKRLKMIYISHHHADHHIGLIRILRQRKMVCSEPLVLLLPPRLDDLIKYHNHNFEDLSDTYEIYVTKTLKTRPTVESFSNDSLFTLKSQLNARLKGLLNDIRIVQVEHCSDAFAVTMIFNIGRDRNKSFTLAYSGDARPSEDFILAGQKCDLLIHESTFDYKETQEALNKKHCTSTEAIQVAKRMGAKFTILTHFSQKLPKIPYITDHFDDTIGFAFDNMAIRCPTHFERLPIMRKILSLVFSKSLGEIEARHAKQDAKRTTVRQFLEAHNVKSMN